MFKQLFASFVTCAIVAYAAPAHSQIAAECLDANYDPNTPPPGWAQNIDPILPPEIRWDQRANYDESVRCNLTPPLTNINADVAFDSYQAQTMLNDSNDGGERVIMIDVRTPEELYWVGVPAQVNKINLTNGQSVVPDNYRAELVPAILPHKPPYLKYKVNGKTRFKSVKRVENTELSGMVFNVPVSFRDANTGETTLNPDFGTQVDALVQDLQADRVIFYCRSGQRSSIGCYYQFCPFGIFFSARSPLNPNGPLVLYEVETDLVDENGVLVNGRGGFEGTSYGNRFLGYRGFPGRVTSGIGDTESASFKDAGLPMIIGKTPKTVEAERLPDGSINVIQRDELDVQPWGAP